MHHFKASLFISFLAFSLSSGAVPVYLSPSSLFSSGSFPREVLERKTSDIRLEAWYKVKTADNKVGWLPSNHVLTPLDLTQFVYSKDAIRIRTSAHMESLNAYTWPPDLKLKILEVRGDWVLCERLTQLSGPKASWLRTSELKIKDDELGRAWLKSNTRLTEGPSPTSQFLDSLRAHRFVHVLAENKDTLKVKTESFSGYIAKNQAVTLKTLAIHSVYPKFGESLKRIPLRKEASTESSTIVELKEVAALKVLDRELQKWGQVRISDEGTFWWAIDDDSLSSDSSNEAIQLTTSELFDRKIYDMVSSPDIPYLKFASARGIFKTLDGKVWTQIAQFKDENYPLAVSPNGNIFIGAFVSSDHGETFEPYLRWENVITAARLKYHSSPRFLQLLKVLPLDFAGNELELKMDLGLKSPNRFRSLDRGATWQAMQ